MVSWLFENLALTVETIVTITAVLYVILAAREDIRCWLFGILSSVLSIWLFIKTRLYAESVLYFFYVMAGIYGWISWNKPKKDTPIVSLSRKFHAVTILSGTLMSLGLYLLLTSFLPNAAKPLIDSFTTIFAFIATVLTIRKDIKNWIYWVVIDAVSVYVYFSRGLYIYAILMLAYTFMAIYGYINWKRIRDNYTLAY